jgi:DnaK suppressor protein
LDRKDLQHFRDLLLSERKRVLDELDWVETNYMGQSQKDASGDVSGYSMHPADAGTDSMEREKAYLVGQTSGAVLEDIDEALRNIESGTYGICTSCGEPIDRERLEAVPYAQLCLKCKTGQEGSRRR